MGRVKSLMMDYEERMSIVDNLINIYSHDFFDDFIDSSTINTLYELRNSIHRLDYASISDAEFLTNLFNDEFMSSYYQLTKLFHKLDDLKYIDDSQKEELKYISSKLKQYFEFISDRLRLYLMNNKKGYNSEDYYNQQIEDLQNQKNELENYLKNIQNQQRHLDGKSNEEIKYHKQQVQNKEAELKNANIEIENLQKELEEKKRQENAILEWDTKIKKTFSQLTLYLAPIRREYKRLNILFCVYACLIALIIILAVFLECIICYKFSCNLEEMPKWQDYLVLAIPIPLAGFLLWAFISQANRAQRQLVILAKYIHEIEYIEGLLLSINSLSSNIQNSIIRVNLAIDKLLENHLKASDRNGDFSEEGIIHEEKKDMVPYDFVIKLLKEAKGFIGK